MLSKKELVSYRSSYESLNTENEGEIDKFIRYLSGGALVLSFTFIGNIVESFCIMLLFIAWGFLVLSLMINFYSYFYSKKSCKNSIKAIRNILHDYNNNYNEDWIITLDKRNNTLNTLNIVASLISIIGVILMAIFVAVNI